MNANLLTTALVGLVVVPGAVIAALLVGERIMRVAPARLQAKIRPWLWSAPALVLLVGVLLYPALSSIVMSLFNADGSSFVGLENFHWMVSDPNMLSVLRNNAIWLVIFPLAATFVGLIVAILSDKVHYERVAKAIVLLPTAISFAVTGVIWQLMYQYRPPGSPQTGTLSAFTEQIPFIGSQAWVQDPRFSTFALIFAALWGHVGLATLILSAAVKGVPGELVEAARIDGANGLKVMLNVILPALWPSILVVLTTQSIYSLKVFDIVYVMTNGNYGTDVIANKVYSELYVVQDIGHATAMAVLLFVLASPVIVFNIRQLRQQEGAVR